MNVSTNAATRAPTALGFLGKLPREVRNEVYHLVLCQTQAHLAKWYPGLGAAGMEKVLSHGIWHFRRPYLGREQCKGWLLVLQVSKEINREVIEHVYVYKTLLLPFHFLLEETLALPAAATITGMNNILFGLYGFWDGYGSRNARALFPSEENMRNLCRAITDNFGGITPSRNRCLIRFVDFSRAYGALDGSPLLQAVKTLKGFKSITLELKILRARANSIEGKLFMKKTEMVLRHERIVDGLKAELEPCLGLAELVIADTNLKDTHGMTYATASLVFYQQRAALQI